MVSKEYGSINVLCNPPKMINDKNGKDNIKKILDLKQEMRNKFKK